MYLLLLICLSFIRIYFYQFPYFLFRRLLNDSTSVDETKRIINSVVLFVVYTFETNVAWRARLSLLLLVPFSTMANLKGTFEIRSFSTIRFKVNKTRVCEKKRGSERNIERERERKRDRDGESKETEENDLTFKHGRV